VTANDQRMVGGSAAQITDEAGGLSIHAKATSELILVDVALA
jgi:hypothetical protein